MENPGVVNEIDSQDESVVELEYDTSFSETPDSMAGSVRAHYQ